MGKLIDDKAKLELHRLLTAAENRESLYVSTALFSAILAAGQVTGISIKQLEKKGSQGSETAEIGEFFLDIAIDLVITGLGGKVLQTGLEKVLRPLIRSKQAYFIFPSTPTGRVGGHRVWPVAQANLSAKALRKAQALARVKLEDHFTDMVNSNDFEAFKTVPLAIGNAVLLKTSETVSSKVNLPATTPPPSEAREGDLPSVQVLQSAHNHYIRQTTAVTHVYGELKGALQYTKIDTDLAKEWTAFLTDNIAEGYDETSLLAYRDHLFRYYEFVIWAHSTDLASLSSVMNTHVPHLMGEERETQFVEDIDNYKLIDQRSERTVYRFPGFAPNYQDALNRYGGVIKERIISIPKDKLEYWIKRFPYNFDDVRGPTVLERFQNYYRNYQSDRQKAGMRVAAYEFVLKAFESCDGNIRDRFRKLRDHRALLRASDIAQP
ncbi:hypothetical protein SAMN04488498_13834 [Mesorhizobium albiziae]|uniref:Uncharacterized protein n=1 Tax=Neomesorhizobium albiziae TaxID=335020 RepID=A0A1I4F894_9HYPH|nr:hypothetical protein [Mesorhizobium albiziae]GLS29371.1 hypothetical protein GCM10007937_10790 [Mesorhizobium albiziae]SFL13749.1 hypothetical protein SAMN04488498_13834 [Mesorhizobium albiziae]